MFALFIIAIIFKLKTYDYYRFSYTNLTLEQKSEPSFTSF